jgi:hypothetical protein
MHAVKRRAGDEWGDFIGLRRCADAEGQKDCRRDSRIQCKPARHGRYLPLFFYGLSIRPQRWFGKRNLPERDQEKGNPVLRPRGVTACRC